MMQVFVDFDLILIAIFITIFITGYIRGGGIELLRVLKVIIPFFVLYFWGDQMTLYLFSKVKIVDFTYKILPNIPFKNTISVLSTHITVYIIVYLFLTIFLWRLGKYVLDERIEYIFGRFNSILGGIFSLVRMYIIVSILILPFYAFNYTNHEDFVTNLILNHPPMFSKIGMMIETTKPTVDKVNQVSTSLKIMDVASLQKYTTLITDVKTYLKENEEKAFLVYSYLYEKGEVSDTYQEDEFLNDYVRNLDFYEKIDIKDDEIRQINKELLNEMKNYHQVVLWAYDHDIKNMETMDEIINSFIINYPHIVANTEEKLTIEVLAKIKLNTQVYLAIKNWLNDSYQIQLEKDTDLLNDEYLETILDDFHLYKDDLIDKVESIDATEDEKKPIIKQINLLSEFQTEYLEVYKPIIEGYNELLTDVTFKYKLSFSIIKEKNLKTSIEKKMATEPLYYLALMDTIEFLNYFTEDNVLYDEAAQIYVSLFLVDIDLVENKPIIKPVNEQDVEKILLTIDNHMDVFIKTKEDVNKIIYPIFSGEDNTSYLEYLITKGYVEKELVNYLMNSKDFETILDYRNYQNLKEIDRRVGE